MRADNRTRILTALRVASSSLVAGFAKNHQHWLSLPECKDLERQFVQTLKAYAFLLCRMVVGEDEVLKGANSASSDEPKMAPTKRRGKKQQSEDAEALAHQGKVSIWNIEREREEILSAVVALVELPLSEIWLPESSFLNLFTHLAFSLLDTPLNAKSASLRSSCMAILRPLIVTYAYQSECILRFVHKLRSSETLIPSLIDLIDSMKNDPAVLPFISELYREVAKVPSRDASVNTVLAKNIASLVSDTCANFPKLILPTVSLVIELLGHESYTIRSGVIQGIGSLIIEGFRSTRPETNDEEENEEEVDEDDEDGGKKRVKKNSKKKVSKKSRKSKRTRNTDGSESEADEEEDDEEDDEDEAEEEMDKNVAPPVQQTLEALLDILAERLMDTSSYTRSKVVTTWAHLARARAIPLNRYLMATEGAVKRLSDKAANVRKSAIELLHDLIENNPYGPSLSLQQWQERLKEVRATLERSGIVSQAPTPAKKPNPKKKGSRKSKRLEEDEEDEEKDENAMEEDEGEKEEVGDEGEKDAMDVEEDKEKTEAGEAAGDEALDDDQILIAKRAKDHCLHAIKFIGFIHEALPIVSSLLGSKNIGDVTEAIKLLAKAHTFKTEEAIAGIRTVLMLVCSKEAGIKDAAVQAYVDLYLTPAVHVSARDMPVFIARNLISLTHRASFGQLTSLEELLKELAAAGRINSAILPVLWSYFEYKADHRCGALIILSMLSETFPNALEKLVPHLFKFGLGPEIVDHPELAKWTFIALQKIRKEIKSTKKDANNEDEEDPFGDENRENTKKSTKRGAAAAKKDEKDDSKNGKSETSKLKSSEAAPFDAASIVAICNFLTLSGHAAPKASHSSNPAIETSAWYPAAEQAVNAIYYLSDAPSIVLHGVLKKLGSQLARATGQAALNQSQINQSTMDTQIGGNPTSSVTSIIGRIIFVLGHIAIKQLVFIEEVTREQQIEKSLKKQAATSGSKSKAKSKRAKPKKKKNDNDEEDYEADGASDDEEKEEEEMEAIELELGAVGAEAAGETHDEERARLSAQHAMVTKRAIGQFLPLVESIAKSEAIRSNDAMLFGIAVHTLSKCMLVSQESCAAHLELIKSISNSDTVEPKVRSNLVILMGDLAMRFPNLFENHAGALYERLSDTDENVRKVALVVVSHLVLTNMVKPRGHMSDIAVCLEDESTSIVDAARLFFKELAAKDNALMVLLPDTISSLYRKNLDFDTAKSILQFLLSFVDLQRDLTSLVDKLCQQFSNSPEVRSWRYLSYCLSMLNHTDSSIERLASHFKLFKDALHDETTNGFFLQAVRARRTKAGAIGGSNKDSNSAAAASKDVSSVGGDGSTSGPTHSNDSLSPEALEEKIVAIAEGTYVDGLDPEEAPASKRGGGKRGGAKRAGKSSAAAAKKRGRAANFDEYDDMDIDDDDGAGADGDDSDGDKPAPPKRAKKVTAAKKSSRPTRAAASKKRYQPDSDSDVDLLEEDSD